MKTLFPVLIFGMFASQAFAIELPEVSFEPSTMADGQPASRVISNNLNRTQASSGSFGISRITVSAKGRQINIAQPAQDNLTIPMVLEGTGLIGMQWESRNARLTAGEIAEIQPKLNSAHNGRFIHRVSGKYLRRSPQHAQRSVEAFLAKVAYPISIRPIADPTLVPAGSVLPVRIYLGGKAVGGALLTAENRTTGEVETVVSDEAGFAVITLREAGDWRLRFSQIPLISDRQEILYTALLEFTVQGGEQP